MIEVNPSSAASRPRVSIVIPVHGAYYRYLQDCLLSVLAQTYTEWEATVVDDGSDHNYSREIVEKLAHPRVRFIRHDRNRGLAATRNTGIRNSSGDLILPVDSDDKLAPAFLEKVVGALISNPDCNAAYADFYMFGLVHRTLPFLKKDIKSLVKDNWMPGPGTLYRRALWKSAGGYCEAEMLRAGNEDWDFWLSASAAEEIRVVRVAEPLYHYRQHSASMLQSLQYTDHLVREYMYERHRELIEMYGTRRRFLGEGYRRGARAALLKKEYRRGIALAFRACSLAPAHFALESGRTVGRAVLRMITDVRLQPSGAGHVDA